MSKESVANNRVVDLFKVEVKIKGVRGLAREVGISPAIITRYMNGKVGEPTTATLQKLAAYFGVSVAWLRGGPVGPLERFLEGLKLAGIDSGAYNQKISKARGVAADYWRELVTGAVIQNRSAILAELCGLFGINADWVQTGYYPRNPSLGVFSPDAPIATSPAVWGLTEGLEIQSDIHKERLLPEPRRLPTMLIGNISKDELQRIMEIITGDVKANNPDSTDHEILEAVKHSKQAIIDEVQKALKKPKKEKPDSE